MNIAELGIAIDSRQVKGADGDLKKLGATAAKTEAATESLGKSAGGAAGGLGAAGKQAKAIVPPIRSAGMHTANLAAQFNDIGVMLAAGQSPLLLAAQQGTQVNQVLNTMGGTGAQKLGALRTAFTSIISPSSLLTLGIIAGGAALAQWALNADGAATEAQELEEAIKTLTEQTAEAEAAVRAFFAGVETPEQLAIVDEIDRLKLALTDAEAGLLRIQNADFFEDDATQSAAVDAARIRVEAIREELAENRKILSDNERKIAQEKLVIELKQKAAQETAARARATVDAQALLRVLERQVAVESMIAQFGADSAAVTRLRAQHEREAFVEATNARNVSDELKQQLIGAYDAAAALSAVNMTDNIANGASAAAVLARNLGIALNAAISLKNFQDSQVYSGRGQDPRRFEEGGDLANYQSAQGYTPVSDLITQLSPAPRVGSGGGGAGGLGGVDQVRQQMQSRLEALREGLMTEAETVEAWRAEQEETLNRAREMELLNLMDHKALMFAVEEEYQNRVSAIEAQARSNRLKDYSSLFGALASVTQAGGKKMVKATATFQAAQGIINAHAAAILAMGDPNISPAGRLAARLSVLAAGLKGVAAIKSAGDLGGGSSGGGSSSAGITTAEAEAAPRQDITLTLVGGGEIEADLFRRFFEEIQAQAELGANFDVRVRT